MNMGSKMFVRQPVSSKKTRRIISFIENIGFTLISKNIIESIVYVDKELDRRYYLLKTDVCNAIIISFNKYYIPFLETISCFEDIPSITVDEGAAKAVLRGADLMAPGVKNLDEFEKDKLVVIKYNNSYLALGKTLYSSSEIKMMNKGKIVEILHYKGDKLWRRIKSISTEV